jgi:hypothetical protein
MRDPSVARDHGDPARQPAVLDVAAEVAVYALEAALVEAELGRIGLGFQAAQPYSS